MKSRDSDRLSAELSDYLQSQHPFVVVTISEDGWPCAEVVSWIWARDDRTVRMVIGAQRQSVANIRANSLTALQILGAKLAYEVRGKARVIKERCESIVFPQTMVELAVDSVRENMYPANSVTGDVPVSWPESTDSHHHEWNVAIDVEMRTAASEA
ncbi:MAG: pyridoxamine 5'-phosphate oxidase family protein [Anaerolineales bacterium]|jgi:hypothetical protein|nr:pyridoxamine 5'-phosphate oxidase family protein [Anaerolineales bacterium]|tara:strand:+ start:21694 stop:22161 length:468 start_codon:yes stop_codon:yes gene_type:complete